MRWWELDRWPHRRLEWAAPPATRGWTAVNNNFVVASSINRRPAAVAKLRRTRRRKEEEEAERRNAECIKWTQNDERKRKYGELKMQRRREIPYFFIYFNLIQFFHCFFSIVFSIHILPWMRTHFFLRKLCNLNLHKWFKNIRPQGLVRPLNLQFFFVSNFSTFL